MTCIKQFKIALCNLLLYPLKCDIAVFDAAHSSVFVNIAESISYKKTTIQENNKISNIRKLRFK